MKKYIVQTTDMNDDIHLELMKYTTGSVGELSRLISIYVLSATKKDIKKIKKLPFVVKIEENSIGTLI